MLKSCLGGVLLLSASGLIAQELPQQPTLYELVINGETFQVEANRLLKLPSKEHPGTTYEIALRVSPIQRLVLNGVKMDYDLGFQVQDDRGREVRTATMQHQLGFTVVLSDLGGSLQPAALEKVLGQLRTGVETTLRADQPRDLTVSKPYERRFGQFSGQGVTIRYFDRQDVANSCLVYVFNSEKVAVSCVVRYLDTDAADILPLLKRALDTLRPLR